MSWNNGYERKKFEIAQRKQAEKYRKLGMTEEQILEMHKFDLEQFKSTRRFYSHTVALEPNEFDASEDAEDKSPLLKLFPDALTTTIDDSEVHSRFWWVEEIDDPELSARVKMLPQSELEALTMYVFENMNQADISVALGISQPTISRQIKKIEEILRKVNKNGVLAGYYLRDKFTANQNE